MQKGCSGLQTLYLCEGSVKGLEAESSPTLKSQTALFLSFAQDMDRNISINSEKTLAAQEEATSPRESNSTASSVSSKSDRQNGYTANDSASSNGSDDDTNNAHLSQAALTQTLSHRKSQASGHEGEEWAQIEKLISRMFGHERKASSKEEKTRHAGVVWKDLTVKGLGLGAALQPTNGDIFLGIPRLIKKLFTRGRKGAGVGKPELRTILDDFTVGFIFPVRKLHSNILEIGLRSPRRNASGPWSTWFRMFYISESHWQPKIRI